MSHVCNWYCPNANGLQYGILLALYPLQLRHNRRDRVSNHQPHDCLLNRLFQYEPNAIAARKLNVCEHVI